MKKVSWKRAAVIGAVALAAAAGLAALVIFVAVPFGKYSKAGSLEKKGDVAGAYDAYDRMGDYGDAAERKDALRARVAASRSAETMDFGGREWLVLEERDGKALLLLKDILEARPFNEAQSDTSWETCTLRVYLNGKFYQGFQAGERARVAETAVRNSGNAQFGEKAAAETRDHVFLLSLEEAKLYFAGDDARVARDSRGAVSYWWLRSPGPEPIVAATVGSDGALGYAGTWVSNGTRGVRPALWVAMD
jgi:hypothetical protein